jgi:hypothetical protein
MSYPGNQIYTSQKQNAQSNGLTPWIGDEFEFDDPSEEIRKDAEMAIKAKEMPRID